MNVIVEYLNERNRIINGNRPENVNPDLLTGYTQALRLIKQSMPGLHDVKIVVGLDSSPVLMRWFIDAIHENYADYDLEIR